MPDVPIYDYPEGTPRVGCPYRRVQAQSAVWLDLFAHYDSGFLWREGGVANQPAKYLRAMALIRSESATLTKQLDGH